MFFRNNDPQMLARRHVRRHSVQSAVMPGQLLLGRRIDIRQGEKKTARKGKRQNVKQLSDTAVGGQLIEARLQGAL